MSPDQRIILALDVPGFDDAVEIIDRFHEQVEIFKVGSELFTASGPGIIEKVHAYGKKVFLDLKFHDIPTTVYKSALAAARLGVFMFNVHTLGGAAMMQQAAEAVREVSLKENVNRPKVIGVTILTSMDQERMQSEMGISLRMSAQVKHLASMAQRAGLDGVVASAEEAEEIRARFGRDFLIVTPGIRPAWAAADDQKRTLTPREAIKKGADYLVIGRAVLSQPDPPGALKRIEDEIAGF